VPRPDTSPQRRREFAPLLAAAFAELGYRRATTAVLARRCGVRENILYRLWPDKQGMFIAALDFVYQHSESVWSVLLAEPDGDASPAERILGYEAAHHGEHGLYRLIFAGLSETDEPEIARALKRLYGRFQRFVRRQVEAHRGEARAGSGSGAGAALDAEMAAWAIVGLGTVANVGRELGLLGAARRRRLILEAGAALLGPRGGAAPG